MGRMNLEQRLFMDLHEMSTALTKTVTNVMPTTTTNIDNNTNVAVVAATAAATIAMDYSSNPAAMLGLYHWNNDDGGGGGGGGEGNGRGGGGAAHAGYALHNAGTLNIITTAAAAAASSLSNRNENLFDAQLIDIQRSDYMLTNTTNIILEASNMSDEHCNMFDYMTNKSYWNVTCDAPIEYAVPGYGYIMPFFTIITIISNSLIVLVLSKKHMTSPTNFVLLVMAICDLLTAVFPSPGFWYMYTFGNHYKPLHPVPLCLTYKIFNDILPATCHTASVWLTLALAVQRYIYVCHAPMARTWCTMPRIKRCTLYIIIVAMLHQGCRLFDITYEPLHIEWQGQQTEVCHFNSSPWVDAYIGENLYYSFYFLFRVLCVHLLPCIILVTLNILLFSAMRQANQRRKLLFRENRKKECKKLRESNCTTLMLIVVVTVFLIAEIPLAVVTALHIFSNMFVTFLDYNIANICIVITNVVLTVSYPINFGIYCGMSRQFRETFKEIFLGRLFPKKDKSSKYSIVNGPRTCTNTNETVL